MKSTIIAAVALTLASVTSFASAGTITTYSDLGNFQSAMGTTPMSLETFTDQYRFPISTGVLNSQTNLVTSSGPAILPGMIQAGVTYSTPIGSGNFFNIDCCAVNGSPFLDTVTNNGPLTVTFDHDQKGFAFDSGYYNNGLDVTINFANGQSYNGSFAVGGWRFYGFTSNAADIRSVVIGGGTNGFSFAVDNFRFSNTVAVPEPETYAMMLLGLGALGAIARRRARKAA